MSGIRWLVDQEIEQAVSHGLTTWELNSDPRRVQQAIREELHEILEAQPRESAVRLCWRLVQLRIQSQRMATIRALAEAE